MAWTNSGNKLKSLINEVNKKHHSIKFDLKFSKEKIEFLDTLVNNDHNNRWQINCRPKSSPCKICTPSFTKKEYSLQSSIKKKTCFSTFDEYKKHSHDLVKRFVEKGYTEKIIRNQLEKLDNLERSTLLNKTNSKNHGKS